MLKFVWSSIYFHSGDQKAKTERETYRKEQQRWTQTQREEDTDGNRQSGALHLISTSTREAGKVSQASALTSPPNTPSHLELPLSQGIEMSIHLQIHPPEPPATFTLYLLVLK